MAHRALYEAWGMQHPGAVLLVPRSTRAVSALQPPWRTPAAKRRYRENGGIPFQIRPFEFKTFRIELA